MLNSIPSYLFRQVSHLCSTLSSNPANYLTRQINFLLSYQLLDFQRLRQSHTLIITSGNSSNVFIAAKLISFYASLCEPNISTEIFNSLPAKDTFLWNSIIKAHFSNGDYSRALEFYQRMRFSNTLPNNFTIPMAVSACAELLELDYGETIYGLITKLGIFSENSATGSSLLYMYTKCSLLEDARRVFDEMRTKDVVAWTALVVGFVQNGESEMGLEYLFKMHRVCEDNERPNARTLGAGFQACGNLGAFKQGRSLHGLAIKNGLCGFSDIQSSVLTFYSKCMSAEDALPAFRIMEDKDIVSWTSVIVTFAKLGLTGEWLRLFQEMQDAGITPDAVIISCLLSTFGDSLRIDEGKAVHGFAMRRNYVEDPMVQNALMSMYCKCGKVTLAEMLFGKEYCKSPESWNLMVQGYNKVDMYQPCILLFQQMQKLRIEYNVTSFISVISSCSQLGAIHLGRSLHCFSLKSQMLCQNISIFNSLVDMYGKLGQLDIAKQIFCRMERDTVSWNSMIAACTRAGNSGEAIEFFGRMISEGLMPNSATLITVLSACSQLASLSHGERVHKFIDESNIELNLPLATALIDMYGKCGQLEKADQIFKSMNTKDVISWNVMISCYGLHGNTVSAIETFREMEKSSVTPNELTFLAVLSACSHAGLVEDGRQLFGQMKDYYVRPTLKHYACMIDLLGKSGNLKEAEEMVLSMPIAPDGGIWGALLTACQTHNDSQMAVKIAELAIEADPENDGYYMVLANLFDSMGKWNDAETIRNLMKERGVKKKAGWSAL